MPDVHQNFAQSIIAVAPSPPTTGLSLTVAAGEGARFGVPCNLTVWPPGVGATIVNAEIVRATSIAGDVITLGARAQETTPARSIAAGWNIADTLTVATLNNLAVKDATNVFTSSQEVANGVLIRDATASVNSRLWNLVSYQGAFYVVAANDSGTTQSNAITVTRPGTITLPGDVIEKGRLTPMGHWVNVAANANYFAVGSGGAGNWDPGSITTYAYTLIGKTLHLTVFCQGGAWYAGGGSVYVLLPGGYQAAWYAKGSAFLTNDAMGYETCTAYGVPGSGWVIIYRNGLAAFPAAAGVSMGLELTVPIT